MNELEFIRHQVGTERSHMAAVRNACAASLAQSAVSGGDIDFLRACAAYLVFIVGRFNAQDRAHGDQLRPRVPAMDAGEHAVLDDLERTLVASGEAIGALELAWREREAGTLADADFRAALRTWLAFYANVLASRRHVIHHLFELHYRIVDWRAASAVDADAILEERERYARVADLLPDGVALVSRGAEVDALPLEPFGTPDNPRPPTGAGP